MKPSILDRILGLFVVPERDRLRALLVPELADLRQQLADARRLAGEAQGRFRQAHDRSEGYRQSWMDSLARAGREQDRADRLAMERDQLKQEFDQLRERYEAETADATKARCMMRNELVETRAERDQMRARVAGLEAGIDLYRAVGFPSERPAGQSEIEARLAADSWEAKRHMKDVTP